MTNQKLVEIVIFNDDNQVSERLSNIGIIWIGKKIAKEQNLDNLLNKLFLGRTYQKNLGMDVINY